MKKYVIKKAIEDFRFAEENINAKGSRVKKLVFDEEASKKLDSFFATRPKHTRTPNNERQAQIVEGAVPLQNLTGLAVGGIITVEGVTYVVLPGPPSQTYGEPRAYSSSYRESYYALF